MRERNGSLIASGREPPSGIPYRLPDLLSRLSWGLTLRLDRLSDDDKIAALELFARARGMILTRSVIHYLLTRENRDLSSLRRLVCRLDHATLAAKRKLTLPFVKTFLSDSP
jgi:DnaA family protein